MTPSPRIERASPELALVALLAFAGALDAGATELRFARRGEAVATRDLPALRKLVEPGKVHVLEPYEEGEATFDAFRLPAVLDAVYGPGWRDEEELLFTCRDGYQPTVPVARVLAHRPWLAFDRVDAESFTILKRESGAVKPIELGPYYLVWENFDDPLIRLESDYGWPYQLVGIDFIRSADHFPKLAPPPGASSQVRAGFAAFRIHCSKCHALNGEGGHLGPELNAPGSPLADRDPTWLRSWIIEPSSVRPNTRMEALNPNLPDRDRIADEIVGYLQAMVGRPEAP